MYHSLRTSSPNSATRSPNLHPPGTKKISPLLPAPPGIRSNGSNGLPFLPFVRLRLLALIAFATVMTIVMITVSTRLPSSFALWSKTTGLAISPKGLRPTLWNELTARRLRDCIIEPEEVNWTEPSTPWAPVPWSQSDLIPRSDDNIAAYGTEPAEDAADGETYVNGERVPRHRIEAYPLQPDLSKWPLAPKQNELLFGITTTTSRAKVMSELWVRWMVTESPQDRPGCMILLSDQETSEDIESMMAVLRGRGLDCGIRISGQERYEVRVMSLVKELPEYAQDQGREFKWFVFNDDDTYWLDPLALRRMLGKYDPSESHFIGATSESQEALDSFGRMAFGGAGMLASQRLIEKMHEKWPDCLERFHDVFGGDEMLTRCAALATGMTKQTVTTEERGLHQFDIPGDSTGILQSGLQFLTLHHYMTGSWIHIFGYGSTHNEVEQIRIISRAAAFLGGDNLFKRYVFGDGHWLMTNGYSLTYYEKPLRPEDLTKMEHTWYREYRLSFDDRPPIEERHGEGDDLVKQTYYIDDIRVMGPKTAILTYIQADKWDESLSYDERVRINVFWDGCWNGGPGCDEKGRA